MTISKNYVGEGVYKNEAEIQEEFSKLKTLSPEMLKSSLLFQKDKTFFLQVYPDRKLVPNHSDDMHPHYYWLMKAVRQQKSQHMFPYRLNAVDFKDKLDILKQAFNVDSYEEFNDLYYIVVN